jgi:uncharacterized RDD family membrane protein YckC
MASKDSELVYAGFWYRCGANLLDSLLIHLLIFALLLLVYGMIYLDDPKSYWGPAGALISYAMPPALILSFWIAKGATPGKMAIGATIVDSRTGGHPTARQFVIRYFASILSLLILFLGYFWIVFDARKQSWHDKFAGTVVVRRKAGIADQVSFEAPLTGPMV